MGKRQLSERDICTKFITPALEKAGWDISTQIREEYPITKGRIIVRGKLTTRARHKRADYVLFLKPNLPIAVIEAKDNTHTLGDGMQQALGYAELLDVPFVFSTNGNGFLFHNKLTADGVIERELSLDEFPSADTLWKSWAKRKGLTDKQSELVTQDYYSERAQQVKKRNYFTKYGEKAQLVLDALLDKYADEGLGAIEETQILSIDPFTQLGTPVELIRAFGGITQYEKAVNELEGALYCA